MQLIVIGCFSLIISQLCGNPLMFGISVQHKSDVHSDFMSPPSLFSVPSPSPPTPRATPLDVSLRLQKCPLLIHRNCPEMNFLGSQCLEPILCHFFCLLCKMAVVSKSLDTRRPMYLPQNLHIASSFRERSR